MILLTYDLCLLITNNDSLNIINMQINNIIILEDEKFSGRETNAIIFKSKEKTRLNKKITLTFNKCTIVRSDDNNTITI